MLAVAACVVAGAAGCARPPTVRAAPFGGELAAPLPHADVLGFLAVVPSRDGDWLAHLPLPAGFELSQVSVAAPFAAMAKLAVDHPFVAPGAPLAIVLLDPDVHGALAAFAWRGRAAEFEAAARAAGLRFDGDGRLLLPGRGRSFEVEVLAESMRRRQHGDDDEAESLLPGGKERPWLPHAVVERDGVVMVLPARDGARNVLETIAATRLLDADGESLPCLRLASGRILARFRDLVSDAFQMAVDQLVPIDWRNWDESTQRTHDRLFRTSLGTVEALASIEEVFACRADGRWRMFLRMRPGSFGASLLDAAADRPLPELLADVPQDVAFVAGSFDPKVIGELPERLARTRDGFLRRVRVEGSVRAARNERARNEDAAEESARGAAFLAGWSGRFWCAGALDGSRVAAPKANAPFSFKADAVGETQLALLFERKDETEGGGFVPMLVDTLVPKPWRASLKLASFLVYRPIPVEHGLLEVVAGEADATAREMRMKMDAERRPPAPGPERAFLVVRAPVSDWLAGDLCATRVDAGIELAFCAAER